MRLEVRPSCDGTRYIWRLWHRSRLISRGRAPDAEAARQAGERSALLNGLTDDPVLSDLRVYLAREVDPEAARLARVARNDALRAAFGSRHDGALEWLRTEEEL